MITGSYGSLESASEIEYDMDTCLVVNNDSDHIHNDINAISQGLGRTR